MKRSGSKILRLLRQCRVIPTLAMVAGTLAFGAACSDSGGGGGGGGGNQTAFLGIMSAGDGLSSGELTITLATSSPGVEGPTAVMAFGSVNASGAHNLGGTSVPLSGTYDDVTKAVALTGAGGWTVDGVFDDVDRLEGIFAGPKSGTFVTTKQGNGAAAYCGTFTGTDNGTFSFVINGNKVLGSAVSTDGTVNAIDGVRSGNNITIYAPGSTTIVVASGTISGTTVSGTFDTGSDVGTWLGGPC